jgi:hypothetical protein
VADEVEVIRDCQYPCEISVKSPHGTLYIKFGRNVGYNDERLIRSVLNIGELLRASKIRDAQKAATDLIGGSHIV